MKKFNLIIITSATCSKCLVLKRVLKSEEISALAEIVYVDVGDVENLQKYVPAGVKFKSLPVLIVKDWNGQDLGFMTANFEKANILLYLKEVSDGV